MNFCDSTCASADALRLCSSLWSVLSLVHIHTLTLHIVMDTGLWARIYKPFKEPRNRQPFCRTDTALYRSARLYRLAELIPRNLEFELTEPVRIVDSTEINFWRWRHFALVSLKVISPWEKHTQESVSYVASSVMTSASRKPIWMSNSNLSEEIVS